MLKKSVKDLIQQSDNLFSKKANLDSLWQEIAENFNPIRADFTSQRYFGKDFASQLASSYPLIIARSFCNAISTFLRPKGQEWFKIITEDYEELDNDSREWLEKATITQRRVIYDPESGFDRAAEQVDYDYSLFGNGVMEIRADFKSTTLLHKAYHLKDCAWSENENGVIDSFFIKRKITAIDLKKKFGDKIHKKVEEKISGQRPDPYFEFNVQRIVLPNDGSYNDLELKTPKPFVSFYVDMDNEHLMEEVGLNDFDFIIPRFQLASGCQYAYSPATITALPDARLIQAMTFTLLEAGQKAVNPPLIATQDAVLNQPSLESGAINYIDYAYDERLGEALRPMSVDKSGLNFGLQLRQDVENTLLQAFYLDKLNLPPIGDKMTATEVTIRIQEYIRNALPLFQPLISDYNSKMCLLQFRKLFNLGVFGQIKDMPQGLSGKQIKFTFENPLIEAEGKDKAQRFLETKAALAEAAAIDPSSLKILDVKKALRDTLNSSGVPAKWLRSEKEVEEMDMQEQEQMQVQETIQQLGQGAQVAEQIGKAGQAINQAGLV